MSEQLISLLARNLANTLGKLTEQTAFEVRVSTRPPDELILPLGLAVTYRQGNCSEKTGQLAWGVTDRHTALGLAAIVARNLGLPAPSRLDRHTGMLVSDLLSDTLLKSLNSAHRQGLVKGFDEPSGPAKVELAPHPGIEQKHYALESSQDKDSLRLMACLVAPKQSQKKNTRVLVVDDSRTARANFKALLTAVGLQVEEAEDGEKALERFKSFRPQLCLMDLEMPGKNGLEVILAMKELDPATKYLMVTSHDQRDAMVTAQTLGVFDYLTKPVEEGRLLDAVNRALESPSDCQ